MNCQNGTCNVFDLNESLKSLIQLTRQFQLRLDCNRHLKETSVVDDLYHQSRDLLQSNNLLKNYWFWFNEKIDLTNYHNCIRQSNICDLQTECVDTFRQTLSVVGWKFCVAMKGKIISLGLRLIEFRFYSL